MSKHETWRTRKFWQETGGLLIEEFMAVRKDKNSARRLVDGVIVLGEPKQIHNTKNYDISGRDIIVIQTKRSRLCMYLLGQSLFSKMLIEKYNPKSIRTVAICGKNDEALEEQAKKFGIEVVIIN